MYTFISLDKIINFFLKYDIDITLFNTFQQALIILLSNILVLLFYGFVFYIVYKIIHKILSWWF